MSTPPTLPPYDGPAVEGDVDVPYRDADGVNRMPVLQDWVGSLMAARPQDVTRPHPGVERLDITDMELTNYYQDNLGNPYSNKILAVYRCKLADMPNQPVHQIIFKHVPGWTFRILPGTKIVCRIDNWINSVRIDEFEEGKWSGRNLRGFLKWYDGTIRETQITYNQGDLIPDIVTYTWGPMATMTKYDCDLAAQAVKGYVEAGEPEVDPRDYEIFNRPASENMRYGLLQRNLVLMPGHIDYPQYLYWVQNEHDNFIDGWSSVYGNITPVDYNMSERTDENGSEDLLEMKPEEEFKLKATRPKAEDVEQKKEDKEENKEDKEKKEEKE